MSKVSVCVTHYNRPELLRRAVSSVIAQGDIVGEIIIVDDCSAPEVQDQLRNDYKEIDTVRLVFLESNSGAQVARNLAISSAVFEYISLLDCDDYWLPGKLKKQIAHINFGGYDLCACGYVIDGNIDSLAERFFPPYLGDPILYICSGGHMQTSTILFKKNVFDVVDFDVDVKKFQDWDFVFRVGASGFKVGYLDERLVDYSRLAPDQMTKNYNPDYAEKFINARVGMIGNKCASLFYINRLSAMYFNSGRLLSGALCFLQSFTRFGEINVLAVMRAFYRFFWYKFGRRQGG